MKTSRGVKAARLMLTVVGLFLLLVGGWSLFTNSAHWKGELIAGLFALYVTFRSMKGSEFWASNAFSEMRPKQRLNATPGGDLAQVSSESGFSFRRVYEAKAHSLGVPFIDLTVFKPDGAVIACVPSHIARRHSALPLKKDGKVLYVAVANPKDDPIRDDLSAVSACTVRLVLADAFDIGQAIERAYGDSP